MCYTRFVPHREHNESCYSTWEITGVCSETNMKLINILCGQNTGSCSVKGGGTYSNHSAFNRFVMTSTHMLIFLTNKDTITSPTMNTTLATLTPSQPPIYSTTPRWTTIITSSTRTHPASLPGGRRTNLKQENVPSHGDLRLKARENLEYLRVNWTKM